MYCRTCGSQIENETVVCMHCGCKPLVGHNYCQNCGATTTEGQVVCLNCGFSLQAKDSCEESERNMYIAAALAFFLGYIGIHDFYLGYTKRGVIKIVLTVVLAIIVVGPVISSIWAFVDFIKILAGSMTDSDGKKLTKKF